MDHFPMLCRMLKYASFLGPFPWHSNKYAPTNDESVHQAMHKHKHTTPWADSLLVCQHCTVTVSSGRSTGITTTSQVLKKKLLSTQKDSCQSGYRPAGWLTSGQDLILHDPSRSDRIKFGYLITFRIHQQRGDWWSLVSFTYFRFFTMRKCGDLFTEEYIICRER